MSHRLTLRRAQGAAVLLAALAGVACKTTTPAATDATAAAARPAGWDEVSHGKDTKPDATTVFPLDKVNTMTVTIAPSDWQAMLDDMSRLYGARGTAGSGAGGMAAPGGAGGPGGPVGPGGPGGPGGAFPGGALPDGAASGAFPGGPGGFPGGARPDGGASGAFPGARPDGAASGARPDFGASGAPGGPGGGMGQPQPNPIWSKATIGFNGQTWDTVGVRFKGNSSLSSAWRGGGDNIPLKLSFDQWEDDHPEIKNQRFYGYQSLSLSSNWSDATAMRDTLIANLLRDVGLVAPHSAFYDVVLDHGSGQQDLGVFTLLEEIDDTVIPDFFKKSGGNIYKPDGQAASFAEGTQAQIPTVFQKENNKKDNDWSDVTALYDVLHGSQRTTDAGAWRKALEKVFDVDSFLHVLAVLAVASDWDSYGAMPHNYYLYDDPSSKRLVWIAWDHNLALGAGGAGGGRGMSVSLDKQEVTDAWPLIRYLLDQPTYHEKYVGYIKDTVNGPFTPAKLAAEIQQYQALLAPYAARQTNGQATFTSAVEALNQAILDRSKAVTDFLATNP